MTDLEKELIKKLNEISEQNDNSNKLLSQAIKLLEEYSKVSKKLSIEFVSSDSFENGNISQNLLLFERYNNVEKEYKNYLRSQLWSKI